MKADSLLVVLAFVLLAAGGLCGFFVGKGCNPPTTRTLRDSVVVRVPDTLAMAQVYAEGFNDGLGSVQHSAHAPVIRVVHDSTTRTEVIYDQEAIGVAALLAHQVDSLIAENGIVNDLVLHQLIEQNGYRASLFCRVRERSFAGTEITRLAGAEIPAPETHSFWSGFGWGPQAGVGMLFMDSDGKLRIRAGGYVGIGIHYSF